MPKRGKPKDPGDFLRNPPEPDLTPDEYAEYRERMREADIRKAKRLYGEQP